MCFRYIHVFVGGRREEEDEFNFFGFEISPTILGIEESRIQKRAISAKKKRNSSQSTPSDLFFFFKVHIFSTKYGDGKIFFYKSAGNW